MAIALEIVVACPMCRGTGKDYSIRHHRLVDCELCRGTKFIPLAACRGCGLPATKLWPPRQIPVLRYCGNEACFSKLVVLHKAKKLALTEVVKLQIALERASKKLDVVEEAMQRANHIFGPAVPPLKGFVKT